MARAYQTLSLFELCAGAEPFSAAEVAAVLAPMLGHLAVQHAQDAGGAGHGNLSLASVAIHVSEDHDGTVHLPPPLLAASAATHVRCVSCMAPEDTVSGQSTQAADIWSVGVIAVQMLLGRQCAFAQCGGHCWVLVHEQHTLHHAATRCNTLQHAATRCNTLQHTATHCNSLQHTATHCNTLQLY